MNRIKTKIIIMVTNRLAAAKDSDAKMDLIEELSENLYQRYLDLAAQGLEETEALKQAMDNLGEVEPLLDYLKEEEADQSTESSSPGHKEETSQHDNSFTFRMDSLENSLENIVNAAISTARAAASCARDMAKDVSDQFREKYPDGMNVHFSTGRKRAVACTSIEASDIHRLEITLTSGDVQLRCSKDPDATIDVLGDTDEIETLLGDDGTLTIRQGNTASSSFLFTRGIRYSNIEVFLPAKLWEHINIRTVNGDVEIIDCIEAKELTISATSGDVELAHLKCDRTMLRSTSGDITGKDLPGQFYAETMSGDIDVSGQFSGCKLISASGNIHFSGESKALDASTSSGDVELELDTLPLKMKASSVSGDCSVAVPPESGFRLSYRTSCGEFNTNLSFTGVLKEKRGEVTYLDGGSSEIELSSVSGDVELMSRYN